VFYKHEEQEVKGVFYASQSAHFDLVAVCVLHTNQHQETGNTTCSEKKCDLITNQTLPVFQHKLPWCNNPPSFLCFI